MSSSNLDAYDLKEQNLDGLIHEDVMSQIWDVSLIPLPFTDMIGSGSHDNQYASWRTDKLEAPSTTGQVVDGADVTGDDTKLGRRIGNHSEIRTKRVEVSTRAQNVNTIGYQSELANQLVRRQQEMKRDLEATALSNNASVEGTDTVAGVTAGLAAWLVADTDIDGNAVAAGDGNVYRAAGGADGGWDATASNSLVAASTVAATPEALSETNVRDRLENIYTKGGNVNTAMMRPGVKRLFSEYLFTSSARIATMINDSPGGASEERKAQGSVDVFITDFGTIKLVPNRLQPEYDDGSNQSDYMFLLDSSLLSMSYLQGIRVEPQAKTGLADKRQMSVDWMLKVMNWDGLGGVADIDATTPMVA